MDAKAVSPTVLTEQMSMALAEHLNFKAPDMATAVQVVFALARHELETVFQIDSFGEESITAALAGALASHATWVTSFFETATENAPNIYWGQYKKNASNDDVANKAVTETESGADFALLVRIQGDHALLGVFQAKIRSTENDQGIMSVDLWRRSASSKAVRESRKSQMITLDEYGDTLIARLTQLRNGAPPDSNEAALDWVHYMIYRKTEPVCASMKSLNPHLADERGFEAGRTAHTIQLVLKDLPTFSALVDLSKLEWGDGGRPKLAGWLSLTLREADLLLPELHDLTGFEIQVVDEEGRSGKAWKPTSGRIERTMTKSASSSPLAGLAQKMGNNMAVIANKVIEGLDSAPPAAPTTASNSGSSNKYRN